MLSILVPARNEEFLQRTIDDVFQHATGDTEVLVALDHWPNAPALKPHPRLQVITTALGQRGATNALAKLSTAKYLMKLDAHVSMSAGFDVKMLEDMEDDLTLIPALANLHAYDWVCPQGHRHFQGKYDKCGQCGSAELTKEIIWRPLPKPIRSNFYFDTNFLFQYMPTDPMELLHPTMTIQGSCFMTTRDKYHELNLCDEAFGSWGTQGIEVACKTWLSGGRVLASRKVFLGHQFRTTEGFPYHNPDEKIFAAQAYGRDLFFNNKWPPQKRSFQSLVEQFNFPGDWTPEHLLSCPAFPTAYPQLGS